VKNGRGSLRTARRRHEGESSEDDQHERRQLAIVKTSFTLPAALIPMRFVTRMIAMKTAFKTALPRSSFPGRTPGSTGEGDGKTARENTPRAGDPTRR